MKHYKTLFDNYSNNIPVYERYMYLQGYSPAEIRYAHKKKMIKELQKRKDQQSDPTDKEVLLSTTWRIKK